MKSNNILLQMNGNTGWLINLSASDTMPVTKMIAVKPAAKELALYEGRYFSEETNSSLLMYVDSAVLMIRLKPNNEYALVPTYKDAFKINALDCNLQFSRDGKNKISLLKISTARARNVAFKKL
jgi:hypothetical protein